MTFSQRRRLIEILKVLATNGFLPFILGFALATLSVTNTFVESVVALDKAEIDICVRSTPTT